MLYITKLINKNNQDIYIYMTQEDYKKYAFTKKGNFMFLYEDKNLLDALNNTSGKIYEESADKNKKRKLTLKEKIQKSLSILGIVATIIAIEPAALELVSYSLKKVNSISHTDTIDENTETDDYLEQFSISINKNNQYNDKEKEEIIKGFSDYINDWGYLLNETDKKYILHMIENVKINRSAWMPKWARGDYALEQINIKEENDYLNVVTHETCHLLSDRGLLVGTINGYGLGYAINEGINTSVNSKYYSNDDAYDKQVKDIMKLSLLVDNETLVKSYQKEGPALIASEISKSIPGITYIEVLKYISMLDIELFIDTYQMIEDYKLSKDFYKEKEELYNKMFKAKYGYDFSESVMAKTKAKPQSFLEDDIFVRKETEIDTKFYKLPKECLAKKDSNFEYEKYSNGEYFNINYNYLLKILVSPEELRQYETIDEFIVDYAKKYPIAENELNQIKTIFTEGLTEDNINCYIMHVLDRMLTENKSPEYIACYLKLIYKSVKDSSDISNIKEKFDEKLNKALEKNDMHEVADLYHNSDICFKNEDAYYLDELVMPEEYRKIEKTGNYIITETGVLILNVSSDESYWNSNYGDQKIHLEEPDSSIAIYCKEKFDYQDGKYYYANLHKDLNTSEIDTEKVEIYVLTKVKVNESTNKTTK